MARGMGMTWRWACVGMPCRRGCCGCAWAEEVKGELGLWEQEVPAITWESGGEPSQDGQEVVLEGAYSTLGSVPAVHMWWEPKSAIVSHDSLVESGTNLVVHSMFGGGMVCMM